MSFLTNKTLIKTGVSIFFILFINDAYAIREFAQLFNTNYSGTAKAIYHIIESVLGIAGILMVAKSLIMLGALYIKPETPLGRKAQEAGPSALMLGALIGALLGTLSVSIVLFVGTATGSNDMGAFEKLKESQIESHINDTYVINDLKTISAVKKDA